MDYVFSPHLGREEIVLNQEAKGGSLYFTTDTRKIYLDIDSEQSKIPIGSTIGLFYGQMELDVPPDDGQVEFEFDVIEDIVGNNIPDATVLTPNVNDLILNSDGCFYKVITINDTEDIVTLTTEKLTIAGTGGGGGAVSGGSTTSSFAMSLLRADLGKTVLYQTPCPISFAVKVLDDLGMPLEGVVGEYQVLLGTDQIMSGSVKGTTIETPLSEFKNLDLTTVPAEELNTIDVGPFLKLQSKAQTIKITVDIPGYGTSTRSVGITTTDVRLDWEHDDSTLYLKDASHQSLRLDWEVSGNVPKTTFIIIDDNVNSPIIVEDTKQEQFCEINFLDYGLYHGVHKIEMYSLPTSMINEYGDYVKPQSTFHNIFVVEPTSTETLIGVGLFENELTQYNTVKIPILIYNPEAVNGGVTDVILREQGSEIGSILGVANLDGDRAMREPWIYTPTTSGDIVLTVLAGTSEKSLNVQIAPLDIDVEETDGYAFKFKASEFVNNTAAQNWNSNGIVATYSDNFDWINGGLQTEEDPEMGTRQFIKVKAGSTLEIGYPLFEISPKPNGKTIKIIFKTSNCKNYDAQFLTCTKPAKGINIADQETFLHQLLDQQEVLCGENIHILDGKIEFMTSTTRVYDLTTEENQQFFDNKYIQYDNKFYLCTVNEESDGENVIYVGSFFEVSIIDSFAGLLMTAQSAIYKSQNNTLVTQYCENSYIELELDFAPSNKRYITYWIDGIPCGYIIYDSGENFSDQDKNKILIGSTECDIDIYLVKVYEKTLSNEEHLKNFIADAPSAEEMMIRFNRNDILDKERNEISPALLAQKNPNCLVHVYEVPRMPKTKKDEIAGCKYWQYLNSDTPWLSATDVTMKVQGTSSEKYVVAAANLDCDFSKNGFTNLINNQHLTGWSMSENAIPIDFACTKVNVASCENANNALNQEWYNMFQPYKTVVRCKNEKARDTMQFTNGVVFVQDNNKTINATDPKDNNVFWNGKENDPYVSPNGAFQKMYSIGQMGNSKDNIHVFHDQENELECCVEVNDNQEPQQWMVNNIFTQSDIDGGNKYYGFRFPKKSKDPRHFNAWKRFVDWMATSNPQPKYKEHKAENQEEFNTFAINPKTGRPIATFIMNEDRTDYNQVTEFKSGITTYYTLTDNMYGYTNLRLRDPDTQEFTSESYEPYRFRGYKTTLVDESGELWQKDYEPLIKDCVVSQYSTEKTVHTYQIDDNGHIVYDKATGDPIIVSSEVIDQPYEYDTFERRMAKMLKECEDYLCMDSVIYHFLFIERHCMIDNVAKNTFWSTEDGLVWNLTKDYDNDTADGNDNNGKFTRSYGMEPMDKLNANVHVFNAYQSVWFNFINNLQEACEHMYQELEKKTYNLNNKIVKLWSKDDYLWFFKQWQARIPERCWIEDYQRKYHRPYEIYKDAMFNSMMEGGQKKYQRAQYETYQELYMASKYFGNACSSSYSIIRGNGEGLLNYELPVTTYSDCYIHAHVGSARHVQRVKRNEVVNLKCPVDDITNATVYFYPIKVFSTIGSTNAGQVGGYEPEQISFSQADKLRKLVISTKDSQGTNETLKDSFTVENNNLLEELYAANFVSYIDKLDLSSCPNLKVLDTTDSTFTSITLPQRAPLETLYLESPTALTCSDLTDVQTFEVDNFNRLTSVILNNIDQNPATNFNSQVIASTSPALEAYKLTNVNWTISNSNDISTTNFTIPLLEKLLRISTQENAEGKLESRAASLTGELTITQDAYNDASDTALKIYERYAKSTEVYEEATYADKDAFSKDPRKKYIKQEDSYIQTDEFIPSSQYYIETLVANYPNLEIKFEGDNIKLYNVVIYDGNNKPVWTRKTVAGTEINKNGFLRYGPQGEFNLDLIRQASTAEWQYSFDNKWIVKVAGQADKEYVGNLQDYNTPISDNTYFYPQFDRKKRSYEVTVLMKDLFGKEPITLKETASYEYGTLLKDIVPTEIPYIIDNSLGLRDGYNFKGYGLSENTSAVISDNSKVGNHITLWAVFEKVTDMRKVIHEDWFTFSAKDNSNKTCIASPKADLKLGGKITIPSQTSDGYTVIGIAKFNEYAPEITHVFLPSNNYLQNIENSCFSNAKIQYFDFPQAKQLTTINQFAFQSCSQLINCNFGELTKLTTIGRNAFNQAYNQDLNLTLVLPPQIQNIGTHAFSNLHSINSTINIGNESNPSPLLFMDKERNSQFSQSGVNDYFEKIYIYKSQNCAFNDLSIREYFQGAVPELNENFIEIIE